MSKIMVIHGPNLNLLGSREPHIYGTTTLEQINERLREEGMAMGLEVHCFQSNHEGAIIDRIHEGMTGIAGMIINPGAFTHYSYAIRDAISAIQTPVIEVHLSNIHARESFRSHSVLADIAMGQIVGLGHIGYSLALQALHQYLKGT